MDQNQHKSAAKMEPVAETKPGDSTPGIFDPLGRIYNRLGGSLLRLQGNSVPDIQPELRSDPQTSLRLDGFSHRI